MSDITMCLSHNCEKKENCYRYKAKPSEYRQSYAVFKKDGVKDCEHFQPLIQSVKIGEKFSIESEAAYEVKFK